MKSAWKNASLSYHIANDFSSLKRVCVAANARNEGKDAINKSKGSKTGEARSRNAGNEPRKTQREIEANEVRFGRGGATKRARDDFFRIKKSSRTGCSPRRRVYPGGFEPLTFGVGVQRSIQLSYGYRFIYTYFTTAGGGVQECILKGNGMR